MADNAGMNRPSFEIVQPTNHWRIVAGTPRRDYVARRLTDGQLRVISLPCQGRPAAHGSVV
jgi:hypothetical protein